MKSTDFYAACAQVLPVLFLAAAVEFRLFVASDEEFAYWSGGALKTQIVLNMIVVIGFVLTVSLGEIAALRVLAEPSEIGHADGLIISALSASGVTLLLLPLINLFHVVTRDLAAQAKKAGIESPPRSTWEVASAVAGVAVLLAVSVTPLYGLTVGLERL